MPRLKRPLNRDAVQKADDEFYAKHPEYIGPDGKRIPLKADDPLTAEWRELYVKHGGELEGEKKPQPEKNVDEPVEKCPATKKGLYDRIRWWPEQPKDSKDSVQKIWSDKHSEEQVGVSFKPGVIAHIELHQAKQENVAPGCALPIEFAPPDKAEPELTKQLEVDRQEGDLVYVKVPHDILAEIMTAVNGELNYTWLRCFIPVEISETGSRIRSTNLGYPALQRPLYFLPGVLGSELSVRNHKGSIEECFPEASVAGDVELELLVCKSDGTPHRPVVREKLKILDNVFYGPGPFVVYKCKEIVEKLLKEKVPPIYADAGKKQKIHQVIYHEVPYDWRLNIAKSHKDIATEIRGYYQDLVGKSGKGKEHPFLAEKVSLAGHSTGGVIMRGLATTGNDLQDLIEHCFFINVPHLGAPKAEYVFFVGDMEVPLVTSADSFRQLAPDMPIVYFLSANTRYGTAVGADWSPVGRQRRVARAITAGAYDTKKKKLYGYPKYAGEGSLAFNMGLADAAEHYCESSVAGGPGADVKTYVFHSGGHPTISSTRLDGKKVLANKALIGDGTVPTVSQIADIGSWKNSRLFKPTPKNPQHVPAPNSKWIWERILDVLAERDVGSHTIPFPSNMRALYRLIIDMARQLWKGKDSHDTSESGTVDEKAEKTYKHSDMDFGIALVECTEGRIYVEASRAVWSKYEKVQDATVSAGEHILLEISEGSSKSDQDNRIVIRGDAKKSAYKVDFISCDL